MYRVRHAARLAGVSPELLRAWERRYQLVRPTRTPSGYRVYSPADVELLRSAARLVEAGHSISDVARLSGEEIRAAAADLGPGPDRPDEPTLPSAAREDVIAVAVQAIERFDRERLEAALLPALGALSPEAACDEVLGPLLRAIGDGWERGTLSVAAEHFGSALVRGKFLQYLQLLSRGRQDARLVCACLEGERHEGGLLSLAVHAAGGGWEVVYLGATTPLEETLDTSIRVDADLVALSFVYGPSVTLRSVLPVLRRFSERHARPRILAGGRAALAHRGALERAGVQVVEHARSALPPRRRG
jgi:DNA-binding transcriptional MerR regulator/methylmalonyl-CoA mutase cobalamin-binding subunit